MMSSLMVSATDDTQRVFVGCCTVSLFHCFDVCCAALLHCFTAALAALLHWLHCCAAALLRCCAGAGVCCSFGDGVVVAFGFRDSVFRRFSICRFVDFPDFVDFVDFLRSSFYRGFFGDFLEVCLRSFAHSQQPSALSSQLSALSSQLSAHCRSPE